MIMRANMNFEEMSSENLFNVAGGVKFYSNKDEAETVRKEIEKAEIKEKEKKKAAMMVATGIIGRPIWGPEA